MRANLSSILSVAGVDCEIGCCVLELSLGALSSATDGEEDAFWMLVVAVGKGRLNVTWGRGRCSRVVLASKTASRLSRPLFVLIILMGAGGPPCVSMPASSPYSHTRLKKRTFAVLYVRTKGMTFAASVSRIKRQVPVFAACHRFRFSYSEICSSVLEGMEN